MDDDFQDRIQRILNEKKKDDLRQQYGARFGEGEEKLLPEVESEWLDNIAEFERQFENAKQITVRERIGNPTIRPLSEILDSELEAELDNLIELLYQHNIVVDFIHDQEEREVYCFLTEELLDAEMSGMRIPDMYSHFTYEEFHPNDEDDVTLWTKEFLDGLFKQEFSHENDMTYTPIEKENLRNAKGNPISYEQFIKLIDDFFEEFPVITDYSGEIRSMTINGDEAEVEVDTVWQAIPKDKKSVIKNKGVTNLNLARSPYGGWGVIQANIPGWDFL
jgi:hypothetical protein